MGFCLAFLERLHDARLSGKISEQISEDVFSSIADSITAPPLKINAHEKGLSELIDLSTLWLFACTLMHRNMFESLGAFLTKLHAMNLRTKPSVRDLEATWFPLLNNILADLLQRSIPLMENYKLLFRFLVRCYVSRFVGSEPKQLGTVRQPVHCGCYHCQGLNYFLGHSTRTKHQFKLLIASHLRHMMTMLQDRNADCDYKIVWNHTSAILTLIKTEAQFRHAHEEWRKRREEARKTLGQFHSGSFRILFGSHYDGLVKHLGGEPIEWIPPSPATSEPRGCPSEVILPLASSDVTDPCKMDVESPKPEKDDSNSSQPTALKRKAPPTDEEGPTRQGPDIATPLES